MGQPAAKMGDSITATDIHIVLVPSPGGPVATPTPLPFDGKIAGKCSETVLINGRPAAVVGSMAVNEPPHIAPTGTFQVPPTNQGTIVSGSETVLIDSIPAARDGDTAQTCNDPAPLPKGTVVAVSTVLVG
jgi:uncharacterized Zn-binding protein involved in type VI secretion